MGVKRSPFLIEALESRVFLDAALLTETVGASTLPASVSDQAKLKGTLSMTVSNNSGSTQQFTKAAVGFLLSDGPLNVSSGDYQVLKSDEVNFSLANGRSKVFKIAVDTPPGKLADGVYTLTAVVADSSGGVSQSSPGPTLTVRPPVITLSETDSFPKLPKDALAGSKLHVSGHVAITNSGTDPTSGPLTIGIYATTDGIPADGTLVTQVISKATLNAGKALNVPVTIKTAPSVAAGSYDIVAQVTEADGVVTASSPSQAPVLTVTVPSTTPEFAETFTSATPTYTPQSGNTGQQALTALQVSMFIDNTGVFTAGDEKFSLFASTNSTFDSTAVQISGPYTLNIPIPQFGVKSFAVDFAIIPTQFSGSGTISRYVFVQVTDSSGDVTILSDPTAVEFDGPAS